MPWPLYLQYPFDRRLGEPQSWSVQRGENSWPYRDSNSDPSVVQPVASLYTKYAIPAPIQQCQWISSTNFLPTYTAVYLRVCSLDHSSWRDGRHLQPMQFLRTWTARPAGQYTSDNLGRNVLLVWRSTPSYSLVNMQCSTWISTFPVTTLPVEVHWTGYHNSQTSTVLTSIYGGTWHILFMSAIWT
jgi:hypothetical protein